jgi:hypothetical protein
MSGDALRAIRRWMHALLLLGFAGTGIELVLTSHYEDAWQWAPLVLIALAVAALVSLALAPGPSLRRVFQVLMMLCIAAGALGVVLHFQGAAAFQREMDPTRSAWALTKSVMRVKAPPVLAPGLIAQLGLLGLIFSYRHPSETPADSGA